MDRFRVMFFIVVFTLVLTQIIFQLVSPKIVFYGRNEYGPLWVYDFQKQRILSFKKPLHRGRQTALSLEDPFNLIFNYQRYMMFSLMLSKDPKSFLIIGLGGGSLSKSLRDLYPQASIDIVEINPLVLKVAKDYFNFQDDEKMTVYLDDGFEFLKSLKNKKYDLIFIDAFGQNYIPEQFLTDEFFVNLKKSLNPSGLICMNTFEKTHYSQKEKDLYSSHFPFIYSITKGNRVVYLLNQKIHQNMIKDNILNYEIKFFKYCVDLRLLLKSFLKENTESLY